MLEYEYYALHMCHIRSYDAGNQINDDESNQKSNGISNLHKSYNTGLHLINRKKFHWRKEQLN